MTQDESIAIEEIRRTIHSYTIAGDSRNASMFAPLWSADAILEFDGFDPVPGFRCVGAENIAARTASWSPESGKDPSLSLTPFIRHNLTSSLIDLEGPDAARARTYFIVYTTIGPDHSGTYDDAFVREGGAWRFSHRRIRLDWRSSESLFPPLA